MEKECYRCGKIKEVCATNMFGTICKECHRIMYPPRTKLWNEIEMELYNEDDFDIPSEILDKIFILLGKNPYLDKEKI